MRIGVVVHGPNIIDSGYALKLIDLLKEYGDVSARLGGTMGRTAVIDASLEEVIDISRKLVPSDSLKIFYDDNVDVIFLLNYGKSDVTGQVFTTLNEFENLKFAIYDEANHQVQAPVPFSKDKATPVNLSIQTTLLASSKDLDASGNPKTSFDADDIDTFTPIDANFATTIKDNKDAGFNNIRNYKMVIWIEETGSDQTEDDSGKVFAGGVTFSTLGGKGVTGMIAVAKQASAPASSQQPEG